jgi:hypothetical protein
MSETLWNLLVNIFAIIGAAYCAIWAVEKAGDAAKRMVQRRATRSNRETENERSAGNN